MTIPYYQDLEQKNCINFGYVLNDNKKQELFLYPIMGSYLSASGTLVNCSGGHKGNNFYYSVYYQGVRNLLCNIKGEFLFDYDNVDAHSNKVGILREYLKQLKSGDLSNFEVLFDRYYNWAYDFSLLNYEEISKNLTGLIVSDIEIYEYFMELKKNADNLVGVTGHKDKDILGVVIEQEPIIEVTDRLLSEILKDKNDFLVQAVGFDKIETQLRRTITTSKLNINEAFFNYLIMEWQIQQIPKCLIDTESKRLRGIGTNDFSLNNNSGLERELSKEIQLIKKYIPILERPRYFI